MINFKRFITMKEVISIGIRKLFRKLNCKMVNCLYIVIREDII